MTDSEHALLLAMARAMISLLDDSAREMDTHYAQAIQRLAEGIKARRPPSAKPSWSAEPRICPVEEGVAIQDAVLLLPCSPGLGDPIPALGVAHHR